MRKTDNTIEEIKQVGYDGLAHAIVIQAVRDGVKNKKSREEVRKFLASEYCYGLVGIENSILLEEYDKLIERADDEESKRNERKRFTDVHTRTNTKSKSNNRNNKQTT